jgi:hypothetical protein
MKKGGKFLIIVGLNAFAQNQFTPASPPIRNIDYIEIANGTYDEIHALENTDNIDTSNVKEDWQLDTILLAKFLGDLEAGNINNNGLSINKFAIKRRKVTETKPVILGYKTFVNNDTLDFKDYTQGIGDYIYSIVPVGVNNLEGLPNDVSVTSDFAGWFLLDKGTNSIVSFDKFIGGENSVDTTLNQGRVQIETLSRFPKVFYTDQDFHTFQLKTVIIPDEWERSGQSYNDFINKFIRSHKPFLVKGGSGEVYICDLSAPVKSAPQNVYSERDYFEITINCTEIMTENDYNNLFL